MTVTPHAQAILTIADANRGTFERHGVDGRLFSFDIFGIIASCKAAGIPVGVEELQFILQRLDLGSFDSRLLVPPDVVAFVGDLLEPFAPKAVLDCWAGLGLSSLPIQQRLHIESFDAYGLNTKECEAFHLLDGAEAIHLECTDPLKALQNSEAIYDAAIGFPPFGMKAKHSLKIIAGTGELRVSDDYNFLLVLASCLRLKEKGVGVFVVPNSFFVVSGRKGKARNVLEQLGIRVTTAIELPAGTFGPTTSILSHIVLLQRTTETTIFAGRYTSDPTQLGELLSNWKQRKPSKFPQNGRLVDGTTFRGFSPVEFAERIKEQARRMGLVPYSFSDVILQLNAPESTTDSGEFEEQPNAVYLPQMASTAATISQDELPKRLKSYFQLIVNPDVIEPEFLARLLNTPFGQLWRDSLRTGDTIPRIGKSILSTATIYLPPREARTLQSTVVECQHTLTQLRSELNELESFLWQRPANVNKALEKLRTINHEDRFEDWVDTLPFPLASILWLCHTQSGSYREQYERKIHFFEALAEFLAVLHLSAFSAQRSLWTSLRQRLSVALNDNRLSFKMATFGTWKAVVELLFGETRRLLVDDAELCFELFKTRNRQLIDAISSKQLVTVVQATNKIRNDSVGHTGAVGDTDARRVNEELQQHIQTVRGVFGLIWEDYQLLLPAENTWASGVFTYKVKQVVGTRTPFRFENVQVVEPMQDKHLHLKSPNETRSLKLLPLVRFMPSPRTEENACYFYNRTQEKGIRFLSYHFESDPEIVEEFADAAEAIRQITSDRIA